MPINLKWLMKLHSGRLSRRIGLWVFVSVIVIETIIFFPSFHNRKKELLAQIREISTAKISMMMDLAKAMDSEADLMDHLKKLLMDPRILGGTVYRPDGSVIGNFGEPPALTREQVLGEGRRNFLNSDATRYDAAWTKEKMHPLCTLILRHDAASVKKGLTAYFFRIAGLVVIISIFVTFGALIALEPIVLTPILKLRSDLIAAGNAVAKGRQPPEFSVSSVRRRDELGEVISAFVHMVGQTTDAIAERKRAEQSLQESLAQTDAYSRALTQEMEQGRQIQANFLPARLPRKSGWDFAAFFRPARKVAGDFYDLFDLPGRQVGIVVADVCDKGVGAALFMALFRSLIRVFSGQATLCDPLRPEHDPDPKSSRAPREDRQHPPHHTAPLAAVGLTNEYIVKNHDDLGMFATLFFGVLCPVTGQLTYINGGHEPLFVIGPSGVKQKLAPTGPAVGLVPDAPFHTAQVTLDPGDLLFGFTDGVTEARSPADRLFGRKRLERLCQRNFASAADLIEHVRDHWFAFVDGAPEEDDTTLLAVYRLRDFKNKKG